MGVQLKILKIGDRSYLFPNGIGSFSEMIEFANQNADRFVRLVGFENEDFFPYLLKETMTESAVKFRNVDQMQLSQAVIMSQEEYERAYVAYCREYCSDCIHYEEHMADDFRFDGSPQLVLNGVCWGKEKY